MNTLKKELKGKVVVVKQEHTPDGLLDRRFLCEGGFGCNTDTYGEKIFGKWLADNTKDCISGRSVEKLF